ncbi:MAG: MgtC/SapB family protein [Candidatus Lokiarchaeota archaeon]|nr:MgtC/SapB family protein [Candidatus Lokiarchaeota archaeon]
MFQMIPIEEFYILFLKIIISFFCGFVIGIERTRVEAQYGARDHIFFSMISTSLIILNEVFLPTSEGFIITVLFFGGMIIFLLIGSIHRLFRKGDIGYTSTLSMLLAMIVGAMCYYNEYLAITISVIFLIILSTKKQFNKIRSLKDIEWTGTVEFIAIVVLLYILIPDNLEIFGIGVKSIIIIFIIILAVKYFSYFLLKSTSERNLYYISFLGGFAHSEATTIELAEAGASSSSIWLVIQTMLIRMIIVLVITPNLLGYAVYPILVTSFIGLIGSFLVLRRKKTQLTLEKIENPLSIKSALIFAGTYLIGLVLSIVLSFFELPFLAYYIIVFGMGLLSGGASSLFVALSFYKASISEGNALMMLTIGLSAAILNKIFYSTRALDEKKNKKVYVLHLIVYILVTISILISMTWLTILIFNISIL